MARKRKQKPTPEALEQSADAILQADADVVARLAENVELLRAGFEQLRLPNNDPHYLQRLKDAEANRAAIANKIDAVHIIPDKGKTWIGVGLTNPRNHAEALEVARKMGEHFEAKVINHDD